jgi:hypothetical protein
MHSSDVCGYHAYGCACDSLKLGQQSDLRNHSVSLPENWVVRCHHERGGLVGFSFEAQASNEANPREAGGGGCEDEVGEPDRQQFLYHVYDMLHNGKDEETAMHQVEQILGT